MVHRGRLNHRPAALGEIGAEIVRPADAIGLGGRLPPGVFVPVERQQHRRLCTPLGNEIKSVFCAILLRAIFNAPECELGKSCVSITRAFNGTRAGSPPPINHAASFARYAFCH